MKNEMKLFLIGLFLFTLIFGSVNAASFPYLLAQGSVEKVYSMRLLEPDFSHTQVPDGGCYEYPVGHGEGFNTLCSLSGIWFANVSAYYGSFRGLEYSSIGQSYILDGYPPKALLPLGFNIEGTTDNVSHQTALAYIGSTLIGSGDLGYIISGTTGEIWVYFFTDSLGLDFSGYTGGQYVNLTYDTSKFRIMFAPTTVRGVDDFPTTSNFMNVTDVGFAGKRDASPPDKYEYLLGDGEWAGYSNSVRGIGVYKTLSFDSFINKWYVYKNTPTEIFNHVYLERIINGKPYMSKINITAGGPSTVFYNDIGRNNVDIDIPDYKTPIYGIFDNLFGYVKEVLLYSGGPIIPPPEEEIWNVIVNVYDESTYSKYNGATVTKYDLTNPYFNEIKTNVQGSTTLSVNLEHHYNISVTDIGMSVNYVDYFAFNPIQNIINIWIRPIREEIPDKGYLEFRVMKFYSTTPNDINIQGAKVILTNQQVNFTNSMGYTYFLVDAPAVYGYRVDKEGYESVTGNVTILEGEQKYIGILMTVIPPITPIPTVTIPGETPTNPIEAIYYFFKTFGVTKQDNVNLIIAMCICLISALILAYYTRDGLATVAGGAVGFIICLGLGLIPIWVLMAAGIILGLVMAMKYRGV